MVVQGALLLAAFGLPLLLQAPLAVRLGALVLAAGGPAMALIKARERRMRKLEEQLPEVADFLGRALRAGHSFANVLQMVGNEMPEPTGSEFRMAYEEINYGVPMNESLHNLAARIPLTDLRYMVLAVLIQRESGGNLAELLDNVSGMVRSRLKLMAQVRVLSAEGRLSAWILGSLPLGVMGLMSVLNPRYISVLWTDPMGVQLLWYAGGAMLAGFLWMRSVIRIRV
jgi:tight adherence protein B